MSFGWTCGVFPHASLFNGPAIESSLRDAGLVSHLGKNLALSLLGLSFAQFADDRFGAASFSRHDPVLLSVENSNLEAGPVFSVQVIVMVFPLENQHKPGAAARIVVKADEALVGDHHLPGQRQAHTRTFFARSEERHKDLAR